MVFMKRGSRVSDPHPSYADPDPGFEIFADPNPELDFSPKNLCFLRDKRIYITALDPDQIADLDPVTQKIRIHNRIQGLQKCRSISDIRNLAYKSYYLILVRVADPKLLPDLMPQSSEKPGNKYL